jgi:hypothetical protein
MRIEREFWSIQFEREKERGKSKRVLDTQDSRSCWGILWARDFHQTVDVCSASSAGVWHNGRTLLRGKHSYMC